MSDLNTLLAMASNQFDAPRVTATAGRRMSPRALRKARKRQEQVERTTRTVWYAMLNNPAMRKEDAVKLVTPTMWLTILSYIVTPLVTLVAEWVWERINAETE